MFVQSRFCFSVRVRFVCLWDGSPSKHPVVVFGGFCRDCRPGMLAYHRFFSFSGVHGSVTLSVSLSLFPSILHRIRPTIRSRIFAYWLPSDNSESARAGFRRSFARAAVFRLCARCVTVVTVEDSEVIVLRNEVSPCLCFSNGSRELALETAIIQFHSVNRRKSVG